MEYHFQASILSPLGILEITSDGDYINSVHFSDDNTQTILPEINPKKLPDVLNTCLKELQEYFNGSLTSFTVPVRQEGTEFQQKVWNELLRIPIGKTMSYLDLSKKIGDMKAIRALGTTNGKNKIAIIVPCHRVIGTHGSLTGYAGGLWRKQWLLEHEMKVMHGVQTLF